MQAEFFKANPFFNAEAFKAFAAVTPAKMAEEFFKKALAVNPRNASVLNYYGYMLAERGVLCLDEGPFTVRFVTHLDVDDADVEVNLSEVRPDGQEMYVQSGWLRASHRALDPKSTELWPEHTLLWQSVPLVHLPLVGQRAQLLVPPQSTSLSPPFLVSYTPIVVARKMFWLSAGSKRS